MSNTIFYLTLLKMTISALAISYLNWPILHKIYAITTITLVNHYLAYMHNINITALLTHTWIKGSIFLKKWVIGLWQLQPCWYLHTHQTQLMRTETFEKYITPYISSLNFISLTYNYSKIITRINVRLKYTILSLK